MQALSQQINLKVWIRLPVLIQQTEAASLRFCLSMHSLGLGQHIFVVLAVYDSVHLYLSALHSRALLGLECFGSRGCLLLRAELINPCMREFAKVPASSGFHGHRLAQ